MKFTTALVAFISSTVVAYSTPLNPRDVYVPAITYPTAGTVWQSKGKYNVTWDASDAPEFISNKFFIRLNAGGRILPIVLAEDFDPRAGTVEIELPWIVPGDDYGITLFGNSGNQSPAITIQ